MRTDFRLYHGNDLEVLAGLLAAELARPVPGRALLAPDTVLIPQPAMRRWLQKTLAERHGIAANLEFLAPGQFVQRALDANAPTDKAVPIMDAARMRWRLWRVLADADAMRAPVFTPLRPLLGGDDPALAAWQLAGELADAFEKYQAWRRDWLREWDRGAGKGDWQAELWRRSTKGLVHRGQRLDAYLSRFDGEGVAIPVGLPARVFAFATQNVSPDVLRVIASAARSGTLHFYFLSPVRGWWGDLQTAPERLRADPDGVFADEENPLLRANGAAGRDFVRTLFGYETVHPDYELPVYAAPEEGKGLLQRLQRDLLERRPPHSAKLPLSALADPSLQVHACHTRLREVQVLHEQLRALLEDDPQLQPREIAVLTPDVDQYAPFVEAVFGAGDSQAAAIPFALTDGSAIAAEPAAEAFARLLALPEARFGAGEVLSLLQVPAIAEKLQLDAADFDRLQEWLRAAGVRWGLDGAHKAALGEGGERAFSWAWALDRLLLGHASGSEEDIAGVAPLPTLESGGLALLDRFLQGLRALARWQLALATARTPTEWMRALDRLIEDFLPARAREVADRQAIAGLTALAMRFAKEAADAGLEQPVPPSVLRAWFAAALGDSGTRQPFLTGGVTFGRMVPMRLVPFKVICLLGMDDGAFPRHDPPGSLNRLASVLEGAQRRAGDRSVRDDDRALFLQLLGAATQTFYLSYLGLDPRSGEHNPPSVVVSELIDEAAKYFADPAEAGKRMTVRHPLQPFAAAAFGAALDEDDAGSDARRFSYHAGWRAAAAAALGERSPSPPFAPTPLALAREPQVEWTREQLLNALKNPAREFLSSRLGLRVPKADERLEEDEPFDTEAGLERWKRDERVLRLALAAGTRDIDALAQRLLAEGGIPPGAAGRAALESSLIAVTPALEAWSGRAPAQAQSYALDLDGYRLSGRWPWVAPEGLRQFSASKPHGKTLLALGLDALAWAASGETRPIERMVRDSELLRIEVPSAEAARDKLRSLVELARRAQREPLAFMPKAALKWLQATDEDEAFALAGKEWSQEPGGEGLDEWVGIALRGGSPFADAAAGASFAKLARDVFADLPGVGALRAEAQP